MEYSSEEDKVAVDILMVANNVNTVEDVISILTKDTADDAKAEKIIMIENQIKRLCESKILRKGINSILWSYWGKRCQKKKKI